MIKQVTKLRGHARRLDLFVCQSAWPSGLKKLKLISLSLIIILDLSLIASVGNHLSKSESSLLGRRSGFPHWMTSTVQPPSGLESYFLSCRHRMLFGPSSSCSVQGSIFSPTKGTNRDTTGGRTWRWLCIPALQFLADSLCPHLSFCVHPWRDKAT